MNSKQTILHKIKYSVFFFSLVLIILSACSQLQTNGNTIIPTMQPTTSVPTATTESSEDDLQTPGQIQSISSPLLLLETDFNQFDYLDIKTGTTFPFEIPDLAGRISLADSRSPSGGQILYRSTSGTYQTINLSNNELLSLNFDLDISQFSPVLAADEAFTYLPDIKFSHEAMLDAINTALTTSTQIVRYFSSDNDFLLVQVTGETITSLHHYDRTSEQIRRLENAPGLVEDFWISPDRYKVLVMKAFTFEPALWQDRRYYIIDFDSQELMPVHLPDNVDRPSVSWLNAHTLGVTHQTEPVGGIDYSVIDIETMETKQIFQGDFIGIRRYGENLLLIQQNSQESSTRIAEIDFSGELVQLQEIDAICFIHSQIGTRIVLNCEQQSLLLEADFELQPLLFGGAAVLLSGSPNGHNFILVDRAGSAYLLDQNLQERTAINNLSGTPLEIRWLPDSTGFLYRTQGQLHYYDFSSSASQFLLESDLFSDYANFNAIWVEIK